MKLLGSAACLLCGLALQNGCVQGQTSPTGLSVVAVTPASGPVGTAVTIEGSGFSPTANIVKFGAGYLSDITSADSRTLRFTVPEGQNMCPPLELGDNKPCAGGAYPRVQPGSYEVSVVSRTATSGEVVFTVTER